MVLGAIGTAGRISAGMTPMARTLSAPRKSVAGVARSVATKAERVIVASRGCFEAHVTGRFNFTRNEIACSRVVAVKIGRPSLHLLLRNSPTSSAQNAEI